MRHVSLVGLLQGWEHHVPVGCWQHNLAHPHWHPCYHPPALPMFLEKGHQISIVSKVGHLEVDQPGSKHQEGQSPPRIGNLASPSMEDVQERFMLLWILNMTTILPVPQDRRFQALYFFLESSAPGEDDWLNVYFNERGSRVNGMVIDGHLPIKLRHIQVHFQRLAFLRLGIGIIMTPR